MATERKAPGHPYGIHRVKDTEPRLPQAADSLDNTLPIYSNELLIQVSRLNIDAASFVQMEEATKHSKEMLIQIVLENTRTRGKQQNAVTGSGGMLIGEVAQVGSKYKGPISVKKGDRIASLVSLTLTPLHLESIRHVHRSTHQLDVVGHAVLFETSILAQMPKDIPEPVAMAVYDVAGAPATVFGMCRAGDTLVVIGGGGKAGVLSCVAGRRKVGRSGKVIAIEPNERAARELDALGVCTKVVAVNALDPVAVRASVEALTRGKMGDVVVNVASVPDTEMSTLLCAKKKGKILFFGMATSFSKVTLGAEGIASDATMIFGNGYYPKHSSFALDLLRGNKKLNELFSRRYYPVHA